VRLLLACAALAAQALPVSSRAADAARGQRLYESRCVACHSIDENRAGPAHRGVYGRKAGSAPGYDYSPAVRQSKLIWNDKTLARWLADPEQLIPGQKMGFAVPEARDRADLIAYLKAASRR
jgi:cytochrome c